MLVKAHPFVYDYPQLLMIQVLPYPNQFLLNHNKVVKSYQVQVIAQNEPN